MIVYFTSYTSKNQRTLKKGRKIRLFSAFRHTAPAKKALPPPFFFYV